MTKRSAFGLVKVNILPSNHGQQALLTDLDRHPRGDIDECQTCTGLAEISREPGPAELPWTKIKKQCQETAQTTLLLNAGGASATGIIVEAQARGFAVLHTPIATPKREEQLCCQWQETLIVRAAMTGETIWQSEAPHMMVFPLAVQEVAQELSYKLGLKEYRIRLWPDDDGSLLFWKGDEMYVTKDTILRRFPDATFNFLTGRKDL